MADNYAQGTFAPHIPASLISEEIEAIADALGVSIQPFSGTGDMVYLYNEDSCTSGYIEAEDGSEKEVTDEDLYAALQDIIRSSEGRITWFSHEQAYTCSRMRPDSFGGSAVFITADDIQYEETSSWLERRIAQAKGEVTTLSKKETDYALFLACSHFLCDGGELTPVEQFRLLENPNEGTEGVIPWEPFEGLTAGDMFGHIEDLQNTIMAAMTAVKGGKI